MRTMAIRLALGLILAFSVPVASGAAEFDLHQAWEDRCGDCHAHAAALARQLSVVDGKLVGRHHVDDLREFLRGHYLQDERVDAVYEMLLAQASTEARFQDTCATCHGSAAAFARGALEFRGDMLYGSNTKRPVQDFLYDHRHLSADDAEFFAALLHRVAREVGLR